ncbi:MAG: hypothetical protein ACFFD4_06250 [Candidatus Odinarchaeota archaeon]
MTEKKNINNRQASRGRLAYPRNEHRSISWKKRGKYGYQAFSWLLIGISLSAVLLTASAVINVPSAGETALDYVLPAGQGNTKEISEVNGTALPARATVKQSTEQPYTSDEKNIDLDQVMFLGDSRFGNPSPGTYKFGGSGLDKIGSPALEIPVDSAFFTKHWIKDEWYDGYVVYHDAVTGDIDGDGKDEIVVTRQQKEYGTKSPWLKEYYYMSYQTYIYTYDDFENSYELLGISHLENGYGTGTWPLTGNYPNWIPFDERPYITAAALGDGDGIGRDNCLGLIFHSVDGDKSYTFFNIFDWGWSTHYNKYIWNFRAYIDPFLASCWDYTIGQIRTGINTNTDQYLSADCEWGNLDEDDGEELVGATNFGCYVWDPDTYRWGQDCDWKDESAFMNDYGSEATRVNVVVGNFDSSQGTYDGFAVSTNEYLYIYKKTSGELLENTYQQVNKIHHGLNYYRYNYYNQLLAIDLNRDGLKEILLAGLTSSGAPRRLIYGYDPDYISVMLLNESSFDFPASYSSIADIDCDGEEEVLFLQSGTLLKPANLIAWKVNMSNSAVYSEIYLTKTIPGATTFITGNFNGDKITIEYTGSYIQYLYPPLALVAIAAPPTQVGISQAYGNSYSQFGTAREVAKREFSSFSTRTGTQLSVDTTALGGIPGANALVGLAGLTASGTWSEGIKKTTETISTVKVEQRHASGAGFNSILCYQVYYKSYAYEITSHPIFDELVGTLYYISVPGSASTFLLSQDEFNAYYESELIGNETFKHIIGHPETYIQRGEAERIADAFVSPRMSVSQGEQFDSIELSFTDFYGEEIERTTSSEFAGGFSILGFQLSRSRGLEESSGYQTSWGRGLEVEGRVGQIANAGEFRNYRYNWGLVIYEKTNPAGNTYLVVNYYVEDAVSYYPKSTTTAFTTPITSPFTPWYLIVTAIITITTFRSGKRFFQDKKNQRKHID